MVGPNGSTVPPRESLAAFIGKPEELSSPSASPLFRFCPRRNHLFDGDAVSAISSPFVTTAVTVFPASSIADCLPCFCPSARPSLTCFPVVLALPLSFESSASTSLVLTAVAVPVPSGFLPNLSSLILLLKAASSAAD